MRCLFEDVADLEASAKDAARVAAEGMTLGCAGRLPEGRSSVAGICASSRSGDSLVSSTLDLRFCNLPAAASLLKAGRSAGWLRSCCTRSAGAQLRRQGKACCAMNDDVRMECGKVKIGTVACGRKQAGLNDSHACLGVQDACGVDRLL